MWGFDSPRAHCVSVGGVKLSVLVPVYDEAPTVLAAASRRLDVDRPCEQEGVAIRTGADHDVGDSGLEHSPDDIPQLVHPVPEQGRRLIWRDGVEVVWIRAPERVRAAQS